MPDASFYLKTEFSFLPKALIVDEAGGFSSLLVDELLGHGCFVNYFGEEKKENFYYLADKQNFSFLRSLDEREIGEKMDYLFYFPKQAPYCLKDILDIAEKTSAKVLLSAPFSSLENEKIISLASERKSNSRIVFFDCLFGPRIKTGLLGEIFTAATSKTEILIDSSLEKVIYPLPARRFVKELLRVVFSPETDGKKYFLCGEEITLFSFTSLLKKILPEVNFVFSGSKVEESPAKKELEKIEITFSLEGEIQETVDWFKREILFPQEKLTFSAPLEQTPKEPQIQETQETVFAEEETLKEEKKLDFLFSEEKKAKEKQKTRFLRKILLGTFSFLGLFFLFFLLPIGLSLGTGLLGIKKIAQLKKEVEKGNLSSAINQVELSAKLLGFSQKIVYITAPFYSLLGAGKQVETMGEVFNFSENLTNALRFGLLAVEGTIKLSGSFWGGEDVRWTEELGPIKTNLSLAYEQASLAQLLLTKVEPGFNFLRQRDYFEKLKSTLPQTRQIFLKWEKLVSVFPKLVGTGEKRTYLVLFQNNMEIRPTGGFIGSYGIVRLENGKLIDFEVFDVYQADGQLKGHVEPPTKLKEYLGEATWYLRDSNWDPDFPTSARRAQWFLDKETQVSVDGTIAVNLEVAKKVLSAIGEIELSDYQEKVNQENLFSKAEYYSELGTFPGSTQKKDFLGSLAKEIIERIKQAKTTETLAVAGALLSSLEEREMMLYVDDPEVESTLAILDWDGSIRSYQPTAETDSIFTDYLFFNEANLGINKVNFFVQREIDQQIVVNNQGKVEEKLTLTYENQSPSENWPAGHYKNYLRIYLKKGTILTSVFVSDPVNPGLWLPFDGKFLDSSEEHGKSVYGFLFDVPIKSKMKIEINYELPDSLNLSGKLTSYLLLVQKQSGTFPSSYSLSVSYPGNFVPLRVIPSAVVSSQKLLISEKFNKNLIFQIDLVH